MSNYIFRSALNGFNRQDVTVYIEKSQKEALEQTNALQVQIDELRRVEEGLRAELEERVQECEQLRGQMETLHYEHKKETEEREQQLQQMRAQIETARREKESVAQLELDARGRAEQLLDETCVQTDELLTQARAQAQAILNDANEQAEEVISAACRRADEIRDDMAKNAQQTAAQTEELVSSVEKIVAHVSAELRKMDVAVTQLPISFNHLKDGMKAVQEKLN